jgi:hypothetical protein
MSACKNSLPLPMTSQDNKCHATLVPCICLFEPFLHNKLDLGGLVSNICIEMKSPDFAREKFIFEVMEFNEMGISLGHLYLVVYSKACS